MNFSKAHARAVDGALIKRSLWDSWLKMENGQLRFQIPPTLRLSTTYQPTAIEKTANDWEVRT